MDLRRSRPQSVNARARVPERPALPRMSDVMRDVCDLARYAAQRGETPELEMVVADLSGAYVHLRAHADELRR